MNIKNKKHTLWVVVLAVMMASTTACNGQKQEDQQTLSKKLISKNESVSHYPLANIVNYEKSNAKISDFKGKLLILDYWFIGCAPCIKSFPKLMQLQEKFDDKIQIMLVNHMQSKEDVEPFLKNWETKNGRKFTLPSVTSDTILYKVMPPSGYPTMVWIDQDGIYRASSRSEDFNEETIAAFLKGDIEFQEKTVANINLLRTYTPLYVDDNGTSTDNMLWYSTLVGYTEKMNAGYEAIVSDDENGRYYVMMCNKSFEVLIRNAYNDLLPQEGGKLNAALLPNNRFQIVDTDLEKFRARKDGNRNGELMKENLFSYQLISKQPKSKEELKRVMQADLQKYFDLDISWKEMEKECYVLTAKDTTLISDFKNDEHGKGRPIYATENAYTPEELTKLIDVTPDGFVSYLCNYVEGLYYSPHPIFNETGFKGKMDIKFPEEIINNPEEFNNYLWEHYKMNFTLQKRKVRILEIKERNLNP